jgi:hypothetical protein
MVVAPRETPAFEERSGKNFFKRLSISFIIVRRRHAGPISNSPFNMGMS